MSEIDNLLGGDVFVHRYDISIEIHWYGHFRYDPNNNLYHVDANLHLQRLLPEQSFLSIHPSETITLRDGDVVVGNGSSYTFRKSSS